MLHAGRHNLNDAKPWAQQQSEWRPRGCLPEERLWGKGIGGGGEDDKGYHGRDRLVYGWGYLRYIG